MISVVMATYNSQKYIVKQLDSIYNQTRTIDELIIQDDCSKDNTVEIIETYKKKNNISNIYIKKNNENLGYIKTFKEAIKRTKGDIIILCDHDDIWIDNKCDVIYRTFIANNNILALATSFVNIDENDNIISTKTKLFHANNNLIRHCIKKNRLNKMKFKDIVSFNISPGCTCAFSKNIKKEVLRNEYNLPHDYQIMMIACLKNGLYYLDQITTQYRIYLNNTIGLGHQTEYKTRLKNVKNGLIEKENALRLCNDFFASNKEIKLLKKVIYTYKLRVELLKNKSIIKIFPKALIVSLGLNKLYESIIYDIITIIINNV